MKDKTFDLVIVEYRDENTLQPVFQKPIYLAVCGQRKKEILLQMIYSEHYFHRYDIEINNRFIKQQLLIDKFQTPIPAHLDLWLLVVPLAEWLLFVAASEATPEPKKGQKSADQKSRDRSLNPAQSVSPDFAPSDLESQTPPRLSLSQTRKAAERLFLNFDPTPFLPQISNKGKGRRTGTQFPKRPTFKPVKKTISKAIKGKSKRNLTSNAVKKPLNSS